jgi:hypothetical protein
MGWFAINLATKYLNYGDHLQLIAIQHIFIGVSVIKQIECITKFQCHEISIELGQNLF